MELKEATDKAKGGAILRRHDWAIMDMCVKWSPSKAELVHVSDDSPLWLTTQDALSADWYVRVPAPEPEPELEEWEMELIDSKVHFKRPTGFSWLPEAVRATVGFIDFDIELPDGEHFYDPHSFRLWWNARASIYGLEYNKEHGYTQEIIARCARVLRQEKSDATE